MSCAAVQSRLSLAIPLKWRMLTIAKVTSQVAREGAAGLFGQLISTSVSAACKLKEAVLG